MRRLYALCQSASGDCHCGQSLVVRAFYEARGKQELVARQFWVTRGKVGAEKYGLSASRYRQVELEEVFYEKPAVKLERMRQLEHAAESDVAALAKMLAEAPVKT